MVYDDDHKEFDQGESATASRAAPATSGTIPGCFFHDNGRFVVRSFIWLCFACCGDANCQPDTG
jgi:hypothetical protein